MFSKNCANLGNRIFNIRAEDDRIGGRFRLTQLFIECLFELFNTFFTTRDDTDDRAAKFILKFLKIDFKTVRLSDVKHIDNHNHWDLKFQKLSGQIKVAFQVRSIDDIDNSLRFRACDIVARHSFIFTDGRARLKRVDAGKVDERDFALIDIEAAGFLFHRNTGPIANRLFRAGQHIKKSCFSAVGIAYDGNDILVGHDGRLYFFNFQDINFGLPNTQEGTADFDFHRISQRCDSAYLKLSSGKSSHRKKSSAVFIAAGKNFCDSSAFSGNEFVKFHNFHLAFTYQTERL